MVDQIAVEFSAEELREFLEADLYPVEADPVFKEQLRDRLWDLVQRQYGRTDASDDSGEGGHSGSS